jgi:uncharacterized protein YkwD
MRGTRFLLPVVFALILLLPAFASEPVLPSSPLSPSAAENQFVEWVNEARAARGLPSLTLDLQLSAVAREHSSDMAQRGYFSHLAPPPAGNTPLDRFIKSVGELPSIMLGENIAYATQPVFEMIHEGLLNSPKHRANLLNPAFTNIGLGVYSTPDGKVWITQMFTGKLPN